MRAKWETVPTHGQEGLVRVCVSVSRCCVRTVMQPLSGMVGRDRGEPWRMRGDPWATDKALLMFADGAVDDHAWKVKSEDDEKSIALPAPELHLNDRKYPQTNQ